MNLKKVMIICLILCVLCSACDTDNKNSIKIKKSTENSNRVVGGNVRQSFNKTKNTKTLTKRVDFSNRFCTYENTKGKYVKADNFIVYPINNRSGQYGLYKKHIDTGVITKISNDYVTSIVANGNCLYFTVLDKPVFKSWEDGFVGEPAFYKMSLDGSNRKLIYAGEIDLFGIFGDYIYFSNEEERGKYNIYRVNLNGVGKQKLLTSSMPYALLKLYHGNIYFSKNCSSGKIYQYNINQNKSSELFRLRNFLNDGYVANFKLTKSKILIFISDYSEDKKEYEGVYEYDIVEKKLKQLIKANVTGNFAEVDNDIYFTTMLSHGKLSDIANYYISYHVNSFGSSGDLQENIMEIDNEYIGSIGNNIFYSKHDTPYFYNVSKNQEIILK